MRRFLPIALIVAGCLAANGQSKPADESKKPAAAPQSGANPFPEDTSTVPVMPSNSTPALPEGSYDGAESAPIPLPGDDLDPVRSPDDPEPAVSSGQPDDFSSSLAGLANLLPGPEDDRSGKRKLAVKEPTHQEAASKDIEVGSFYLDTKDWKGALSRFESALVLAPENPDVYWGLAEADRHLGNFADARANYEKVAEYDPDSHHGKEARKRLKEPEIADGKNVAPSQPLATETQP
jgi:tetratricopeptide (TPR) repeat protein